MRNLNSLSDSESQLQLLEEIGREDAAILKRLTDAPQSEIQQLIEESLARIHAWSLDDEDDAPRAQCVSLHAQLATLFEVDKSCDVFLDCNGRFQAALMLGVLRRSADVGLSGSPFSAATVRGFVMKCTQSLRERLISPPNHGRET